MRKLSYLITAVIGAAALSAGCDGGAQTSSQAASSQPPVSSASVAQSSAPASVASVSSSVRSSSSVAPSPSSVASSSSIASSSSAASSSEAPINLPLVLAINAGSTTAVNFEGVRFEADKYSRGGMAHTTTDPISGVSDDALYQSERYGTYGYEIPVLAGTYTLELHMAELYWTENGARSFNLSVEGSQEFSALDLHSQVGHDGAFSHTVRNIRVTDGTLNIDVEALTDAGTISGFALYSADGGIDTTVQLPDCNGYVGLTFDDGPTGNTRTFISRLKQNNLTPVTFFVNGQNISDPSIIPAMLEVGQVQSHAFTHDNLSNLGYQQVYDLLNRNNQVIMNAGAPKPTVFRPPYGALSSTVNQVASELGLYAITWDVDSQDWNGASGSAIVSAVGRLQDGQNILLHENQANTINNNTLAQIAANLEQRGLCPGVIDPRTGRVVAP